MRALPLASLSLVSLLIALAALGCGSDDPPKPAPRTVDPTSAAIHAAVRSNASVALKLHSALREQPGNLFYSPISIEAVLGMLYAGSDGETATQIGAVLDVGDDPHELHEGLGALLEDLAGDRADRGYTLSLASRLWAAPGLDSSADFVDTTRELYRAPMESANYADPEKVRRDINRWVDSQTDSKIPELLRAGDISERTVMTVVNAIYLKADWASAFDPKKTIPGTFQRADSSTVSVQMMTLPKTELRVGYVGEDQVVELPYRGGDISFIACVPQTPTGLPDLEASLEHMDLTDVVAALSKDERTVRMPRFSMRSHLDLIPTLQTLGVVDLFDQSLADLTKIDTTRGLFVHPFVHEATVQVDEAGTVAAAATAAAVAEKSAAPIIQLDRPFLFFIRDNLTGAILFAGRVADPTAE
jgi:serpin B